MAFKINLNGKAVLADVEADMPLLWVLRDVLGVRGPKFGCGVSACGACTVHLDGKPGRSCTLPVAGVGEKQVTTIEAMSGDAIGAKVQEAWVELDVAQCGYCQAGQIMAATALLKSNVSPNDAAIDTAMSGNLCRCGTYDRIRAAVKRAAELVGER